MESVSPRMALVLLLLLLPCPPTAVESATNPSDVQALGILFSSLSSPPQLSGWKSGVGDPCGELWKGVSCVGSAVTAIELSGLGLNGTLGYLLSDLLSLITLDVSENTVHGNIPYQLPPNLTYLNLASNHFSGNLPYSISDMVSLNYLNVSHNLLTESIGDIFTDLQNLFELDLSFNNFTGGLPNSFSTLSKLSSLYLEDNQLTGPLNLLANLDLANLNIANNHFTGWIPHEFQAIPNLMTDGNSFSNGPAPPPPPYTPPPPKKLHKNQTNYPESNITEQGAVGLTQHPGHSSNRKFFGVGPIIGIVVGSLAAISCVALAAIFHCRNATRRKDEIMYDARDSLGSGALGTGQWQLFSDYISSHAPTEWSFRIKEPANASGPSSSTT